MGLNSFRYLTHKKVDFDAGVLRYCQEILFEVGFFLEEMRITCGNKDVPETFFHNSEFLLFAKIRFKVNLHSIRFRMFSSVFYVFASS